MSSAPPADGLRYPMGSVTARPEGAPVTYRVSTSLADSRQADVQARQHTIAIDEPARLGGTDPGASPIEAMLAGLVSCQAVTFQIWAAKLGVALDTVTVTADGDIDLRGLFGIDPDVRAGLGAIRLTLTLDGPETRATYATLAETVDAYCPVLDNLRHPVPVSRTLAEPGAGRPGPSVRPTPA